MLDRTRRGLSLTIHPTTEVLLMELTPAKACVACGRGPGVIPLFSLEYRGKTFWICPQHFPILIHDPARLAGKLPGAEDMEPSEHHD